MNQWREPRLQKRLLFKLIMLIPVLFCATLISCTSGSKAGIKKAAICTAGCMSACSKHIWEQLKSPNIANQYCPRVPKKKPVVRNANKRSK